MPDVSPCLLPMLAALMRCGDSLRAVHLHTFCIKLLIVSAYVCRPVKDRLTVLEPGSLARA